MNGYLFEDWIIFLQLHSLGCVFSVFRRYVTRSSWHATVFVFSAFHNYLDAITFLCHVFFRKWTAKVMLFLIQKPVGEKKDQIPFKFLKSIVQKIIQTAYLYPY